MSETAPVIRMATADDALPVRNIYQCGEPIEFAHRLAPGRQALGTSYYVVEVADEIAAVFALTELGRLRPGSAPRLLLHEMRLRRSLRGRDIPEYVYAWLAGTVGAGLDVELVVLGPMAENPPLMSDLGMVKAYHGFKWAASSGGRLS